MVIELKMCRFESVPWGFRLVGGSDYEYPLTVVKVTEESIAEKAGLQVGDIIVRINDIAASALTHTQAHDVILHAGNTFFFGVKRETEENVKANQTDPTDQEIEVTLPSPERRQSAEDNTVSLSVKVKSPSLQKQHAIDEEDKLEQEIAEILSDEKEVLKEHNVVGIFPKPGVCMSSKVLRQLNEDATKTREEILAEQRQWTTFLQKPNRPIPKSKADLEVEKLRQENPYKVVIQKQPKPKVAPDRVPTPPWREPTPIPEPEPEPEPKDETPIADTEVPDLTPLNDTENSIETPDEESSMAPDEEQQQSTDDQNSNEPQLNEEIIEEEIEIPQKTEEELQLEQQLAQVQQQLMALSNLPTTIQATLDAVTKQLAELLPVIKKHTPVDINQVPDTIAKLNLDDQIKKDLKPIEEEQEEQQEDTTSNEINEENEEEEEQQQQQQQEIEEKEIENKTASETKSSQHIKEHEPNEAELESIKWDMEEKRAKQEAQFVKKQKIELWNRMFNGEDIPRHTFRVNFMKYQKPEKKVDLDKSEVFKILHNLDKRPKHGIEVRPPVVPAEEDIRNVAASCG